MIKSYMGVRFEYQSISKRSSNIQWNTRWVNALSMQWLSDTSYPLRYWFQLYFLRPIVAHSSTWSQFKQSHQHFHRCTASLVGIRSIHSVTFDCSYRKSVQMVSFHSFVCAFIPFVCLLINGILPEIKANEASKIHLRNFKSVHVCAGLYCTHTHVDVKSIYPKKVESDNDWSIQFI